MTDDELMALAARVEQARCGGRVERCHTVPHQGSYSVAAHSWGVAMLMHALWPRDFPRLALACLSHDVPEAWLGDMPSTIKSELNDESAHRFREIEDRISEAIGLPQHGELTAGDAEKLRACDWLELYLWTREEEHVGNRHARDVRTSLVKMIRERGLPSPARELFSLWEQQVDAPVGTLILRNFLEPR